MGEKKPWITTVLLAGVVFFSGAWYLQGANAATAPVGPRMLSDVLQYVARFYVDSIPVDSVYVRAAEGLVQSLHDPYSEVMPPRDLKQITEQTTGNYGGLGMQIDVRDGWITVVAPLPQTPAEEAGIEAGDQIIEVEGKPTRGISQDSAVNTLRGPAGTKVSIKIHRPGYQEPIPFTLTRRAIHNSSVLPGTMLQNGVGYVQLSTVSGESADELRREINLLRDKGMKGLVFDLRRNPGGLLDQGVAVSELFLDPGQTVVSTKGRLENMNETYTASINQPWPEMPIVVLVNEFSASAAEIISGALQDNDRAVVVGVPTFGKGLVQSLIPLEGTDRALKLTTGRWYTPSGRTIQREVGSEESQVEQAQREALGLDSSKRERPTYKTSSGRTVKGGGGVVPDLIVRADTTTIPEREFLKGLGSNIEAFRDAIASTALELKAAKTVTSWDFKVTPQMLQTVFSKLETKGVKLTPEQIAGGSKLVSDQLAYETVRYVFDRAQASRRQSLDDPQVKAAVELLRKASTPASLFKELPSE